MNCDGGMIPLLLAPKLSTRGTKLSLMGAVDVKYISVPIAILVKCN